MCIKIQGDICVHLNKHQIPASHFSSCYYMAWKEKLSGHASFLNIPMNLDHSILTLWIKSTNWFYFNLWKCSLHIMNYRPQTTLKWEMKEYSTTSNIFFRISHLTVNLYQNPFHKHVVLVIIIKKIHVLIMSCLHSYQQYTDTHY